jgi:hypothetical protein
MLTAGARAGRPSHKKQETFVTPAHLIPYHLSRERTMSAARLLIVAVLALVVSPFAHASPDRLIVHEWGTFTSLQDESGRTLSNINTDDEPVPGFVHGLGRGYKGLFLLPTEMPPPLAQGAPVGHPQITMRLETPVTYFHLPEGMKTATLDVAVDFHGGWLTEFYPAGVTLADGKPFAFPKYPELTDKTVGRLEWKDVKLGGDGKGPETTEHVWLAPRDVNAANVSIGKQSERFLFYRGVAHLNAPLTVKQIEGKDLLQITGEFPRPTIAGQRPPALWIVDVRPDGRCAFRDVHSIAARSNVVDAHAQMSFAENEYAADTAPLRKAMHAALVSDGLFDDEAAAMLNTWELSYFKSPGLRLFFTVPQTWTDAVLPLHLSQPADVTRVMIGRIELITPRHRELLNTIAAGPVPNLKDVVAAMAKLQQDPARRAQYDALASGRGDSKHIGVPVPPIYQAYLDLGRFRTAIVMNACSTAASPVREVMNDFFFEVQMPGLGIAQQRAAQRAAQGG